MRPIATRLYGVPLFEHMRMRVFIVGPGQSEDVVARYGRGTAFNFNLDPGDCAGWGCMFHQRYHELGVLVQVGADPSKDQRPKTFWEYLGTASHEAMHATGGILTTVGVRYDYHNDEVFAYLQDWTFSRVAECLRAYYALHGLDYDTPI